MEPSGSRLRAEMRNASGAAWTYSSHYGLLALTGPERGLLALFLALLLRAFSGRKGPREASPQPVPPDVVSICNGSRAAGSLPQTPSGDGDTENEKGTLSMQRSGGRAVIFGARRTPLTARPGARPARDLHGLPGCERWLIRLVQVTVRLHERARKPQAPRAAPRTVAPHRPRGLSAPRGGLRSNARECRYSSVVACGTAAQWLGPSRHIPRCIPHRSPAEGSRVGASRTSDPRRRREGWSGAKV